MQSSELQLLIQKCNTLDQHSQILTNHISTELSLPFIKNLQLSEKQINQLSQLQSKMAIDVKLFQVEAIEVVDDDCQIREMKRGRNQKLRDHQDIRRSIREVQKVKRESVEVDRLEKLFLPERNILYQKQQEYLKTESLSSKIHNDLQELNLKLKLKEQLLQKIIQKQNKAELQNQYFNLSQHQERKKQQLIHQAAHDKLVVKDIINEKLEEYSVIEGTLIERLHQGSKINALVEQQRKIISSLQNQIKIQQQQQRRQQDKQRQASRNHKKQKQHQIRQRYNYSESLPNNVKRNSLPIKMPVINHSQTSPHGYSASIGKSQDHNQQSFTPISHFHSQQTVKSKDYIQNVENSFLKTFDKNINQKVEKLFSGKCINIRQGLKRLKRFQTQKNKQILTKSQKQQIQKNQEPFITKIDNSTSQKQIQTYDKITEVNQQKKLSKPQILKNSQYLKTKTESSYFTMQQTQPREQPGIVSFYMKKYQQLKRISKNQKPLSSKNANSKFKVIKLKEQRKKGRNISESMRGRPFQIDYKSIDRSNEKNIPNQLCRLNKNVIFLNQ